LWFGWMNIDEKDEEGFMRVRKMLEFELATKN